jgi:hypothetical protein
MSLSRGIMVLSLAVLVYFLMNSMKASQVNTNEDASGNNVEETPAPVEEPTAPVDESVGAPVEEQVVEEPVTAPVAEEPVTENFSGINYENFDVVGFDDSDLSGAPVNQEVTQGDNQLMDSAADLMIEGTDLLTAPLVDRFYSVNSISNVNRNASNDLRGDIAIEYNKNYTPFYQSAIYGEPLHTNPLQ